MKKRILSFVLTIAMIFSAVLFTSYAEEPNAINENSFLEYNSVEEGILNEDNVNPLKNIKAAAKGIYSAVLKENGTVWVWGSNEDSSGGLPNNIVPTMVAGLTDVCDIAVGVNHMVALKRDGTVWTWGSNASGQLGNGTNVNSEEPIEVEGLIGVKAIAAGENHTVAIKTDGAVWTWGSNTNGQLGNGTTVDSTVPVAVPGLNNIVAIAAGYNHTVALTEDGAVWNWGIRTGEQLEDGTITDSAIPVTVEDLSDVKAIAAGMNHTVTLKKDGSIWSWGYNSSGQLGTGTTENSFTPVTTNISSKLNNISGITAGENHTIVWSKENKRVYSWGSNSNGQLGTEWDRYREYASSMWYSKNITSVAAGREHTIIIGDGVVYVCGSNFNGQLGIEGIDVQLSPTEVENIEGRVDKIAVGDLNTIAVNNSNMVYTWGNNQAGQLGYDTVRMSSKSCVYAESIPSRIVKGAFYNVKDIAAGQSHMVALKNDGTVWTWGNNKNGQLGLGKYSADPTIVNGLADIKAIAAGGSTTFAIKSDGSVYAWGSNAFGQLGIGTTTDSSTPVLIDGLNDIISISTDGLHTVALKEDGTVYTWGANLVGSLGDGTWNDSSVPIKVSGLSGIKAVSAGFAHTVALKENGDVYSWGWNLDGEYAFDSTNNDTPAKVENLTDIKAISTGYAHTVALKEDGTVYAWGLNQYGELGNGTTNPCSVPTQISGLSNIKSIATKRNHTVALTNDGKVYAWGLNNFGQVGKMGSFGTIRIYEVAGNINIVNRITKAEARFKKTVDYGTPVEELGLPSQTTVTLDTGEPKTLNIAWDTSKYDPKKPGLTVLYGTFQLTDGIINDKNFRAEFWVTISSIPPTAIERIDAQQITADQGLPLNIGEKAHEIGGVPTTVDVPSTAIAHLYNGTIAELNVIWDETGYNPYSTEPQIIKGTVELKDDITNPDNVPADLEITIIPVTYDTMLILPESIESDVFIGTSIDEIYDKLTPKIIDVEAFNTETGELVYLYSNYTIDSEENAGYDPNKLGMQTLTARLNPIFTDLFISPYVEIQVNVIPVEIAAVETVEMDAYQSLEFDENKDIPQQVPVTLASGKTEQVDVEWNTSNYQKDLAGDQIITGKLVNLPSGVLQTDPEKFATLIVHVIPVYYKITAVLNDGPGEIEMDAGFTLEEITEKLAEENKNRVTVTIESTTAGFNKTAEYSMPFILREEDNPDYDAKVATLNVVYGSFVLPSNIQNPDGYNYEMFLITNPVEITSIEPVYVTTTMGTAFVDIEKPTQVCLTLSNGKQEWVDVDWGTGEGYLADSDELTEDNPIQSTVSGTLVDLPEYINYYNEEASLIITVILPRVYTINNISPMRIPETGSKKVNLGSTLEEIYNALETHSVTVELRNLKGVISTQEVTFTLREADNPDFDAMAEEEFELIAYLNLPEDIENPDNLQLIISVTPTKYTIKSVTVVRLTGVIAGTPFEEIGLPEKAPVIFTDNSSGELMTIWNESTYNPDKIGAQAVRGTFAEPLPVHVANPNKRQPAAAVTVVNPATRIISAVPLEDASTLYFAAPAMEEEILPGLTERKFMVELLHEDGSITTEIISVFDEVAED